MIKQQEFILIRKKKEVPRINLRMIYHPDLENLKTRFEVFTSKLLDKATELEHEAKLSVQEVYDEDSDHYKRAYGQFKLGIEGQFKSLIDKASDVYNQQIVCLRNDSRYTNTSEWYIEMHDLSRGFEDSIRQKMKNIFDSVILISNEVYLQNILDEYEVIKDAFNCSQCGANLTIDQIYFVSTYITCPFCQTQNTFVPGTLMKELESLSRDLAQERLKSIEIKYAQIDSSDSNKLLRKSAYIFYRAYVWVEKSKIVPIYRENYLKVFLREVHDTLSGLPSNQLLLKTELYHHVVQSLGFKEEMTSQILWCYEVKDFADLTAKLLDWEMLMHLSSRTITFLFQGAEYQAFHDEQFQRIQDNWSHLSTINKAIAENKMNFDEAITIITTKIN